MQTYSVEAYLKATGVDQFAKAFGDAGKNVEGLEKSSKGANANIGTLLKTIVGVAATIGVFRTLTSSLDGAISRFDTLNSFPRVLQLMGFDAVDAEKAIDRLSDGIDGLPTTLDSVASTTQRIATMTGDLDGAVDTTLALNNAFLASGASTADASRGLEQYVQMLSKGEVDLQSWRTLQETMPVALNRTAEAFGFTGRSAQNDLYDALKEGSITFDEFNDQLIELSEATGGFADMARESSTGIRTSWQNVKTSVIKGLADMITSIDDALSSFGGISGVLDSVKAGIQATFSWINANIPIAINLLKEVYNAIKPWTPLILGVITAFLTFNTVISVIDRVGKYIENINLVLGGLWRLMLANPIALVIAALAGLVVMFVYLWNTSDQFREKVTEVFQALLDFVVPIVQTVVDFIMEIWGMLVEWWDENSAQILETAQTVWNTIVEVVMTVVQSVVDFVMEIWGALVSWWNENSELIRQTADTVWNGIKGIIESVMNFLTPFIESAWNGIKTVIELAMNFLVPFLNTAWNDIKTMVEIVWAAIQTAIDIAINLVLGIIRTVMQLINGDWEGAWETVKSTAETIWESIKTYISTVAQAIWDNIKEKFGAVVDTVREKMEEALDKVTEIGNSILDFFSGLDLYESGKAIIQSAIDGIVAMKDSIVGKVEDIVGSIRNLWPFSPAKEGPLSDIHRMDFAGPIGTSIDRAENPIRRTMANLADTARNAFDMDPIDIAGQINDIHARSQRQMSYDYTNELNVNRQPARITLVLGNNEFEAFVDDINEVNAINAELRRF